MEGYKFELFVRKEGRGRKSIELKPIHSKIIQHLKDSGVTDKDISDLTKLNVSTSYINKKFRKEVKI